MLRLVTVSALFAALSPFAGGCQSGGVGDPCVPEEEYKPEFSGFAASELNIESRSFQCQTRVCLVNHFRGRVSCPLGQSDKLGSDAKDYSDIRAGRTTLEEVSKSKPDFSFDPASPEVCRIPGSSGKQAEVVQTSVLPQCITRKASDVVYCSCRCDGDDPNAKYCECPSGFTCKKFPELDLGAAVAKGSSNLRGSYCVKQDDKADFTQGECPQAVSGDRLSDACDASGNCGVRSNPDAL